MSESQTHLRPKRFWRFKTPTVIQMENAECGPACLSILLASFGRFVPLEQLRLDSGVSRDGSNALNLIQCGQKYGLDGKGLRLGLSEVYERKEPCILFWDYNHFVVLEGFAKNGVFINDPAFGPRRITYGEFDKGYTGVILDFKITDTFKKGGKPPSLTQDLFKRLRPVKFSLLYILIVGFCLLIPGLSIPVFMRIFIDNILVSNILPWKAEFLMGLTIAMVLSAVLTCLQQYFLTRLNAKLSIRFSSDFLWHILRLPISFYAQRYPAEIAGRVNYNNEVASTLTNTILTACIDLVLVIFYGAVMLMYDLAVAGTGIGVGICSLILMRLVQRSRTDSFARLQKEQSQVWAASIGAIQQIETIKATGTESGAFSNFVGFDTNKINSLQDISKKDAVLGTAPIFFQGIALAALIGIGGWRVMDGALTPGALIALQILLLGFLQPVMRFLNFGQTMQFLSVMLLRLNDVLYNSIDQIYLKKKIKFKDKKKAKLEGYIEFQDVTFGYSPLAPPLIENFNLKIKPGQRVALVGPSGCGKSTVSKLSTGLLVPWRGKVLYDNKLYHEHPSELLYRSIASVDQDIFLFAGSIRDNLTLWDPTVPDQMLIQAAEDACIHFDILERPRGYDTELIEGGRNLSGGQRQRLEIARALLYNPSILIMDEATSALDSRTEKQVMNHIRKRGCSAVMVAHRLSTIQDCDEIIVLDQGIVVERGNHEQLKNRGGLYQELIKSESKSE